MRLGMTAALALPLVCGMAQPPQYVNPLSPEQLDALRISDIRFEQSQPGLVDPQQATTVFGSIRSQLIERLGHKFAPNNGNSVLVVTLERLDFEGSTDEPTFVHVVIKGKVLLHSNISADYPGVRLRGSLPAYLDGRKYTLPDVARDVANRLAIQVLWKNP